MSTYPFGPHPYEADRPNGACTAMLQTPTGQQYPCKHAANGPLHIRVQIAYSWQAMQDAWLELPEDRRGELWPAVEALIPSIGTPVETARTVLALALGQLQEEQQT